MKQSTPLFTGIKTALLSCLDEQERLKEDVMRRLINWHLDEGFNGFYLTGSTGEGPILQKNTRKEVVELVMDEAGSRSDVIVHVGAIDLITATELAKHAGQVGAAGISSVAPFFFHYGKEQIIDYYKALADASGLPILMYASPWTDVPSYDLVKGVMDAVPSVIGLKWTNYDFYTMHRIKELRNGTANVIGGADECLLCALAMGADGGIGSTYHVMPRLFVDIYEKFKAGDIAGAQQAQFKANKLIEVLLKFGVGVGIRDILQMMGYDVGDARYPQKRFTDEERQAFRAAVKNLNFEEEYI